MRRVKKTPHQFLRNIVTGSLVAITAVVIGGGILQNVMLFMLSGMIAGTGIVIPVGGMFTLYVSIFLLFVGDRVITYFFTPIDSKPKVRRASSTTRRRYVH